MKIDWVELSKGEYETAREQLWPAIARAMPANGSILNGGVSNILAEVFGGAWRMPMITGTGGDYNQIKLYRSALLGEVERDLNDRRLATYKRVYAVLQGIDDPPKRIQSGHVIALLEDLGESMNQTHRNELRHYLAMKRLAEEQVSEDR